MGQDASAAIIKDGQLVFAMEEERLIRNKHARSLMPSRSILEGLKFIKKNIRDVEFVAYYANYFHIEEDIKSYFKHTFGYAPKILFFDHHLCHAASAFFPSRYKESIIFTADYSGDGVSTTLSIGKSNQIKFIKKFKKPNSLGIFYSLFTQLLGFNFDNDEYKVMGLAPYGKNNFDLKKIISVEDNGEYLLNKSILNLNLKSRQSPLYNSKIFQLLGLEKPFDSNNINKKQKDLAASEEIILKLLKDIQRKTQIKKLCMAGGVSLNCEVVKKIADEKIFDEIFVQPASSDAGTSVGAAYLALIKKYNAKIEDIKSHVYLGNQFNNDEIQKILNKCNIKYKDINKNKNYDKFLESISKNNIAAKFREGFRPFAPTVINELAEKNFNFGTKIDNYKHMNINVQAKKRFKKNFPSCTHINSTSRIQVLKKNENNFYYDLLYQLHKDYEIDCLINTSFNLNEQPIVNTPQNALGCFYSSGIDHLLLGDFLISKDKN